MVDLSNANGMPLLGGLAIAGEMYPDATGGLNAKNLLAGGFGAASAQYMGDEITSRLGMQMSSPLAQAIAGAGISVAGRNVDAVPSSITNPMAAGVHYNVAQQAFNQAGLDLGSLVGSVGGGGGNGGTQSMPVQQSTPQVSRGGMGGGSANVVDY